MQQQLKQTTIDKFEEIELNADQLIALEQQIDAAKSAHESPQHAPHKAFAWPVWSVVSAALILMIGLFLVNSLQRQNASSDLLEAIALEVASNHLKLKPLEVKSQNLRQVLSYFDRLDFQLVESASIAGKAGDRLLGGRYCSIQGIDAAQLRVRSVDGELSTWYEATLPPDKLKHIPNLDTGAAPAVIAAKGLQVRIWRRHGVVFAHAHRPKTGAPS